MRPTVIILCASAALLASGAPSRGGGLLGDYGAGALPGAGSFTPLQRGFGSAGGAWRPNAQEQPGWPAPDASSRRPGQWRDGWRPQPDGYGFGLVYPYEDDDGEEVFEEEPLPPPAPPPEPRPRPKPSSGPKTVSAPVAASASVASPAKAESVECRKGRKVSLGGGRHAAFGCVSP